MASIVPQAITGAQLTNALATIITGLTAPNRTMVNGVTFYNSDTVARTVTIALTMDGVNIRTLIVRTLVAGETWAWIPPRPGWLQSAGVVQAQADVGAKVNFWPQATDFYLSPT